MSPFIDILMRFSFFRRYLADVNKGIQQSNRVKASWDAEERARKEAEHHAEADESVYL